MKTTSPKAVAQSAKALVRDWAGTRKRISLWLDLSVSRDWDTLEIIEYMKRKRIFRSSVITGLRIVYEAGQGRFDTLLMTYPDVIEKLRIKITPPPPPPDTKALEDRVKQLQELLEILVANQKANNSYTMTSTPPTTGKLLATAKPLALPSFDDDDDLPTMMIAKNKDTNAAKNFVTAMMKLY